MKLIIQIPCYNEEKTLPLVLKDIPKKYEGVSKVELQIIDDGCKDKTVEVAKRHGVDHVVTYIGNKGLGNAFKAGVEHALRQGADILVNTDGDNQYDSADIPKLVAPIVKGKADIVIGDRQTSKIKHFSLLKKFLQWLGTRVTGFFAGTKMKDAVSGFRAYSREALLQINITSDFSYVLDTSIQAAKKQIKTVEVPIKTNPPTRNSRLFGSMWEHIKKSATNMLRVYAMYEPLKVFMSLGALFFVLGIYPIMRFVFFFIQNGGGGHTQSLVIGSMCVIIGMQFIGLAIVGDLIAKQRRLIEDVLKRIKERE